jgi:GTP-binding protein EngB required for normal cell division
LKPKLIAVLEIAFFGRVSSGKSSLLNCFLGQPVLPVGVTPVTAVPVRMGHGEEPGAVVHFAGTAPRRVALPALADYASEEGNPGNEKLVTRVEVSLPSPRLAPGVALVDTPGLGSLATGGAAATLAYLPRCDVGVVLVDAGGSITPDEVGTIESVLAAGARALVLVSKADLVQQPAELDRLVRYVEAGVRERSVHELQRAFEAELALARGDAAPTDVAEDPEDATSIAADLAELLERHPDFPTVGPAARRIAKG